MKSVVNNVEVDVMDMVITYSQMGYNDLSVEGLPSYEEILAMIDACEAEEQAYINEKANEWLAKLDAQLAADTEDFPVVSFEEEALPF